MGALLQTFTVASCKENSVLWWEGPQQLACSTRRSKLRRRKGRRQLM